MEKSKLLTVVLFCLCFAGITLADEVINVDLNGQGDNIAYTGQGAIAGETLWRAIYEGTGVAVGSARTSNLANYDEPNKPSIYAAQVWLTVPEDGLFTKVSGSALMDDGFNDSDTIKDPCIVIPGEPQDGTLPAGAFNGTYDIYVYGSVSGTQITLKSPAIGSSTKTISGTYVGGPITASNYVVFNDVSIDDGNDVVPGDGNSVTIVWNDNIINGITLVKKTTPIQIDSGSYSGAPIIIEPNSYDVARETNQREGEPQPFGPDLGDDLNDPCDPADYYGPALFYLDNAEYMIYDIECAEGEAGNYTIKADVVPDGNNNASLVIYYYNDAVQQETEVGTLTYTNPGGTPSPGGSLQVTNTANFNIFEGSGYLKWGLGTNIFYNLVDLKLYYNDVLAMNSCDDVYLYKYNYVSDYVKDCRIDESDLAKIVDNWVSCYDPNTANCP